MEDKTFLGFITIVFVLSEIIFAVAFYKHKVEQKVLIMGFINFLILLTLILIGAFI